PSGRETHERQHIQGLAGAKASLFHSGTVWLQPPSARCRASNSSIVACSALRGLPERTPMRTFRTLSWCRSERLAASSQATAFDSAARCAFGESGPVSPCSAMMIQAASVVWLSLIGGRRRVAKNSHEPSGCCFLTISSAISFRLRFCPSLSAGNDRAATARNGSPMFSPRAWGRGSGGSAGLGKIFEAISLSLLPSKDWTVSVRNFLSIAYPCRSASPSAQSGSGAWWQAAHLRVFNQAALSVCRYLTARSTAWCTCGGVARGIDAGSRARAGHDRQSPRRTQASEDVRVMDQFP